MTSWPAVLVSCLALTFTIFSFWWMNWRPAKVRIGSIEAFAAGKATEGSPDSPNVIVLTLPLILFNTGARPTVIESLRLASKNHVGMGTLHLEAVDSALTAQPGEEIARDYFFFPILLKPNEVVKANCVFERRSNEFQFTKKNYKLNLEAKISGCDCWQILASFSLDFSQASDMDLYNLNAMYCVYPYPYRKRDSV